jgi:RimJ/RimL family protein N-acetyltransferase
MAGGPTLHTERLVLRRWREEDEGPFAALNSDPVVMEHFPGVLTREQSDQMIRQMELHFEEFGYGLWAVDIRWAGKFIGFCGLSVPTFHTHFTPAVEIGWRFTRDEWGNGYATEAARAAVDFGFEQAHLDEVLSWTIPANEPSIGVMTRLGMTREPAFDFDHPRLLEDDRLRRHVVYRLTRDDWEQARAYPG